MVRYEFQYTVGPAKIFEFPNRKEAEWAIHNEGDHLLKAVLIESLLEENIKEWHIGPDVGNEKPDS